MTELPTPAGMMTVIYGVDRRVKVPVFDEAQMREYAAAAVAAEREAVLDLVDDYAKGNTALQAAIRARGEIK